jgi:hypothetical protein
LFRNNLVSQNVHQPVRMTCNPPEITLHLPLLVEKTPLTSC